MTAQDLKNSILQLAVEGKLLSRKEVAEALETTEGPKTGAELLEQIKAEKAKLIAEGKIKKATTKAGASGRALAEITEDEKPFDIPENWCWCKLNDISNITKLAGFEYSDYIASNLVPAGIPLFKGQNVRESTISYNFESFIPETLSDQLERSQITKKCLLTPYVGAGVGNVGIHTKKGKFHLGSNVGKIEIVLNDIGIEEYVHVFLKSITGFQEMTKHIKATGIPSISIEALRDVNIPLPPLAEQKAIVAKIEELLPYIQKYDVAHTKLEEFNKKFPVEMQKSILQQAIMGKLTEDWRNEQASLAKTNSACQVDDRSSAKDLLKKIKAQKARLIAEGKIKKDKPLAEITEDEIPFDIPESWCWCRLGDICFDIKRGKSPKYVEKSNYLAFAQKCNVKTGGINLEIALYLDESTISRYSNTDCLVQGDVVINSTGGGTMGRVGYFECEIPKGIKGIYPDSHVTTIRTVGFMEQKFVFYFLKTKQKELESLGEGSTNQTELKPYTLQNLLLPLPPLAEQKAIVAKIEELLPLCKKLVK